MLRDKSSSTTTTQPSRLTQTIVRPSRDESALFALLDCAGSSDSPSGEITTEIETAKLDLPDWTQQIFKKEDKVILEKWTGNAAAALAVKNATITILVEQENNNLLFPFSNQRFKRALHRQCIGKIISKGMVFGLVVGAKNYGFLVTDVEFDNDSQVAAATRQFGEITNASKLIFGSRDYEQVQRNADNIQQSSLEAAIDSCLAATVSSLLEIIELISDASLWKNGQVENNDDFNRNEVRSILLEGGRGAGKSSVARKISKTVKRKVFEFQGSELLPLVCGGGASGAIRGMVEIEKKLSQGKGSLVIFDDLDLFCTFCPKEILGKFTKCLSNVAASKNTILIATALSRTFSSSLFPFLWSFVSISSPTFPFRFQLLGGREEGKEGGENPNIEWLAKKTGGYALGDILRLRTAWELRKKSITTRNNNTDDNNQHQEENKDDIDDEMEILREEVFREIEPLSLMDFDRHHSDIKWNEIAGYASLRRRLEQVILWPLIHHKHYQRLGTSSHRGVMLYGPSGCGKTFLISSLLSQSPATTISVRGPSLLGRYLGESEENIRKLFQSARTTPPCLIFFDEIDSICIKRGLGGDDSHGVQERILSVLLTELDGVISRGDVMVVGCTNRLDLIDPAVLRPGRFDAHIEIPRPSPSDLEEIVSKMAASVSLADDVDVKKIAKDCENMSTASVAAVFRDAVLLAVRQDPLAQSVSQTHFSTVIDRLKAN